jgi:starvation-inducible DNA-binding protein
MMEIRFSGGKMAANSKSHGDSGGRSRTDAQSNIKMKPRMVMTHNDLPEEIRLQMVQLLNEELADTFDLFSQTKQAHWNVKGPDFYQLHLLYDELAEKLLEHVDLIAERATALGGVANGTVRMAAGTTRLPEINDSFMSSMQSVEELVTRYTALAQSLREAIDQADEANDQDTMDLFIEVSREIDKSLWFLEAHLQTQE